MNTQELRQAFNELPRIDQEPPDHTWEHHQWMLRRHVMNDDPTQFLRWSTICATMFVGQAPYIRGEYDELMRDHRAWRDVITEPGFGAPWRLRYAPWTSGNLVHQAFHLKQYLDQTNIDITKLHTIQEIGGGYGAMALVVHRLGFRGEYRIHDLPEFNILQRYYLSNVSIPVHVGLGESDLLIALFSVSEMVSTTERYRVLSDSLSSSYIIGYQPVWKGIDNHSYFSQFAEIHPEIHWVIQPNIHYPSHRYLIGES